MGKKNRAEAGAAASKAKPTSKSFTDQKLEKLKKSSTSSKPKAPKVQSYIDWNDLPSSDSDEEKESLYAGEKESKRQLRQQRNEGKPLDISVTDKQLKKKKRERKDTPDAAYCETGVYCESSWL
ncbi:hypothetical protein OROMI_000669 [Orobanche minor]